MMTNDIILNIVDENLAEESVGQMVSLSILSTLLWASGMVNAATFNKSIQQKTRGVGDDARITLSTGQLGKIVQQSKANDADKMVGRFKRTDAINIIARTLWMEARGDGNTGLNMVMTVVWNRAGGDTGKLADKCLERLQFSCWNNKSAKTPETYKAEIPSDAMKGGSSLGIWVQCNKIASQAVDGKFNPQNRKWNTYYNPDKASPSWGSKMCLTTTVGHHKVGYLPDRDGFHQHLDRIQQNVASASSSQYQVKKGDTLSSIARLNKTTVAKLKQLNGLKSDNIFAGQKLRLT